MTQIDIVMVFDNIVCRLGCHNIYHCLCSGSSKSGNHKKSNKLLARTVFNRAAIHSHGKWHIVHIYDKNELHNTFNLFLLLHVE